MSENLKINNREYGFTIEPYYGKVIAEIYKVSTPLIKLNQNDVHIRLLSKKFGKCFRKPIESDYNDARKWALEQMKFIEEANKNIE